MGSFLDRAGDWRRRAKELRSTANGMETPAAQASLLDMAEALEHHAANLEQTVLKFRDIRETAAAGGPFRDFVLRRAARHGQEGD